MDLEKKFIQLVEKYFSFLVHDYGFKLTEKKVEKFTSKVEYQRPELAFVIQYDFRDFMCFFWLVRIVKEKMPEHHVFVNQNDPVNWFDFNTLLQLRDPKMILGNEYFGERMTEENTEGWLRHQVECLKEYGQDLLAGDVRVFDQLEQIVKKRAAKSQ